MSVTWYRICFDPKSPQDRFKNEDEFQRWVDRNFHGFPYQCAGYIMIPANLRNSAFPLWNILIAGSPVHNPYDLNILVHLSKHGWTIDNQDVLFFIKHGSENERLFPIRETYKDA